MPKGSRQLDEDAQNELRKVAQDAVTIGDMLRVMGDDGQEVYEYTMKGLVRQATVQMMGTLDRADEDGRGLRADETLELRILFARMYFALTNGQKFMKGWKTDGTALGR